MSQVKMRKQRKNKTLEKGWWIKEDHGKRNKNNLVNNYNNFTI